MFKKKKLIIQGSIGNRLKEARTALGLSLESISNQTKVELKYLELIEDNAWQEMPGGVYSKNFLKKYVEFIKLDWEYYKKIYEEEVEQKGKSAPRETEVIDMNLGKKNFMVLPKIVRNVLVSLILLVVLGYVGLKLANLIGAPEVDIIYPPDNFTTFNKRVKITGWTTQESEVKINGQVVGVDVHGYFTEVMDLAEGINNIKIEAKKRQGKTRVIEQKILVESPKQ